MRKSKPRANAIGGRVGNRVWTRRTMLALTALTAAGIGFATDGSAQMLKVVGIYTVPVQQKWAGTLHRALNAAKRAREIDYTFSEKIPSSAYVRVLRQYAESGVDLIVGDSFGISREVRQVADDYPKVAFLMGDPGGPHGKNFAAPASRTRRRVRRAESQWPHLRYFPARRLPRARW